MTSRAAVLVSAALMAACGSSGTMAVMDAGGDALTCEQANPVPDAAIYMCEAGLPGSAGCRAPSLDPNAAGNPNVYPEGCLVSLPVEGTFCGPVGCSCQKSPGPGDAGPQFICPL